LEKLKKLLFEKYFSINYTRDYLSQTTFMHAATCGDIAILNFLIDSGAELNRIENNGMTALHLTMMHNNNKNTYEITKILLENEIDLDIKDKWGDTALDKALKYGRASKIISLLRDKEHIKELIKLKNSEREIR